jgi:uncharacterized protein YfaQ (DUF2300 family)
MTSLAVATCTAMAPKYYSLFKVPRDTNSLGVQLSTDTQKSNDRSNASVGSHVRTQNWLLGRGGCDPNTIYNICSIVKIML